MENVFVDRNDNLFYYQIDASSTERDTEEETVTEILNKFVSYVSIKESVFSQTKADNWTLLKGNESKEVLVVTNLNMSIRDIKRASTMLFSSDCRTHKIYCKIDKREVEGKLELIPYPKEIMHILSSRREDIIRGELR